MRDAQVEVVDKVAAVADELLVGLLLDADNHVAVGAAAAAGVALARHRQLHSVLYAGRNLQAHHLLALHYALAVAVRAFVGYRPALAVAVGARRLLLHLAQQRVDHTRHVARAVAGAAGRIARTVLGARAVAMRAFHILLDLDFLVHPGGYLLQAHLDLDPDVAASVHRASARASAAEEVAEASEDVAEVREDVLHRHSALESAAAGAFERGMAEAVIFGALVGIRQDVVGLGRLLEFFFGLLVTGIFVGVIFDGHLAIRLLYLVGRRALRHAKHFIVISLCHLTIGLILIRTQPLSRIVSPCRSAYSPSRCSPAPCPSCRALGPVFW